MFVIAKREMEANAVSVRVHGKGKYRRKTAHTGSRRDPGEYQSAHAMSRA
jgi:hypothetical protein